ncbi:acyl-CoA dehydratase activase [Desulfallas sp. Bu1-1]|uniref:acyl-CoA dehydratase activase n=1 Tax=Desulfallas sp. Bu1-1 TaxID=2787620 RepID=UPI0028BD1B55|nr:acyl-CoA dehydratase activase [Desulfallas sp. Bu1-1]
MIRLNGAGKVVDFVMNDKCAAGMGRFLEVMARALEVDLRELGRLSGETLEAASISNMCTVFAESEVVSLVAMGRPREEIILGLHESVAERVSNMAWRLDVEPAVTMTGGVAKNTGVVRCIEARLGLEMHIPPEPQIIGIKSWTAL